MGSVGSVENNTISESVENNVQRSGEFPTKFFQKYVVIKKGPAFYTPYYDNGVDDVIQGQDYTKSYTKSEIKKDFIQELKDRFL